MKKTHRMNAEQKRILKQSAINLKLLDESQLFDIVQHPLYVREISEEALVEFLEIANALYRGGSQIISDADYDGIYLAELRRRNPHHAYLSGVEPEGAFEGTKLDLPVPMLSTDKKWSVKEVETWIKRVKKAAHDIGIGQEILRLRVTPKLDGFAAYDDGSVLYTRGDGRRGTDISRVFDRGLTVVGARRGQGAGEIVVDREYFEKNLSPYFENTRNFQATIIKEKKLEPYIEEAIKDGAAVFYPFEQLPTRLVAIDELLSKFQDVVGKPWPALKYDVDGVVIEVTEDKLKNYMGKTAQHYSWQIAYKTNAETARIEVLAVIPQTSRMGRITPVVDLVPTKLSGVTISRATAHNYRTVKKEGIGRGAIVELVRSGLVIPKIEKVVKKAKPEIPKACPSCSVTLTWDQGEMNLLCPNVTSCPAQIINTIEHFFHTLRNIDGFGSATIEKLHEHGIRNVCEIYNLDEQDFVRFGFGEKQSQNLVSELRRSLRDTLEDWRFLAAFGVHMLGSANSEQLLKNVQLRNIFSVSIAGLVEGKIFAEKTARVIVNGLKGIRKEFDCLMKLNFNFEFTKLLSELQAVGKVSPIAGKQVVFTGTMLHGSREDMEREARLLGAKVASSVSGRTDILVTGRDVGQKKIDAASQKNVPVLSEDEYLKLIGRSKR